VQNRYCPNGNVSKFFHTTRIHCSTTNALKNLVLTNRHLTPRKLSFTMGDLDPYLMHDSLNPLHLPSHTAAQSDQPFLHGQWHILPIHYIVPPNFIKVICPFPWGNHDPHVIYLTLGTHDPPPYTAYRSSMPFFQNSNVINNRQTDRMKMELG